MLHETLNLPISRRAAMRSGVTLGAGAAASTLPIGNLAFAQSADATTRWPQVASMVDRYMQRGVFSGIVASMGFGEGAADVITRGNRSFDGGGAVGPDTLYRIYSMTKPITGMAVMMCIDDGLLELDQPLYEILPGFRNMQVQKTYDGPITANNLEPAARPITIRHLLTHTAGLGYTIVQQGPLRAAYGRAGIVPSLSSRLPMAQDLLGGQPAPSLEEFADNLSELPLALQPGTRWSYSVSLDLLGRVIEVVTGEAFDAFLQRRIFDPVGMPDTGFSISPSDTGRMTANYFLLGGMPMPVDMPNSTVYLDEPPFPFGGAGLVSTARDYDRFLQMLAGLGEIDGVRVMSEDAVRLGTSDLFPDTLASNGRFSNGALTFGFGAGGLVGTGDNAGLYGWYGAAGTAGLVHMGLGLRMTMMTQYMPAEQLPLQSEFTRTALQDAIALVSQ
ncbi:serine hydrolase domain-containing protein [Aurantiacibacter sp. MUD61]|uniref:serine hydrolase domain-containing protein n=1 Tax=Aurantiacibacter sp. MUD61 TaxID=3009083 RepID=UPI0022F11EFB|nr:serine hydrolase domain-containing protein [Aurantiacibacter sp. MUD61]